ncbi:G-rich sequence factor 1 [Pseudoliparis swirei]|uniref:G-rich sequence factor 1 n=1 Tax=Pseudoliparis swirei TaxID=2059687 RepID=UPI0024BE4D50|nr:G-rich sequence factor 1 [Pseudoliparis swirei]
MSRGSTSLLFVLQRCVAGRQVTLRTGITTRCRSSVLSARCTATQQPIWASTTRAVCELQSAVRSSRYRFCTKATPPCEDEYPPLPTYKVDPAAEEERKKEVFIMQVKGLPWSCSAQELLRFFSECRIRDGIKGIHLTVDRTGRPSGQAFIELEHEEDVGKALEKHRQYLGPRYVEVYEVTNSDAEMLLKKAAQDPVESDVVRLRGLPFSCTDHDIEHFFSGLDIVEDGITVVLDHKARNSGEAFVQFSSNEAAGEALQRHREVIGNRYIEVFPSRRDQVHSGWKKKTSAAPAFLGMPVANRTASASQNRTGSAHSSGIHYIHMRGLPFQVSGEDVAKFFSPLAVSKILMEFGAGGQPTGEADVYFSCHKDALTAMSRDRMFIGERYIELFLNSDAESDETW